ncbi:MAG: GMC family oxidoreductase N-terminal domain-containing protein [Pseudomonadota bacterium]
MSGAGAIDAAALTDDLRLETDVAIVGSGAGGGVAAETLSAAGLRVVVLEEGRWETAKAFSQNEAHAFPQLYQASGAQRTRDKAILVFQGRAVGGGTTVNWTASFPPPERTLAHWAEAHDLAALTGALAPHLDWAARRFNIHDWSPGRENPNNAALARGCAALGHHWGHIPRNVRDCADTGLCGLGCPVNAKQSTLVTCIPAAVAQGATVAHGARARRVLIEGGRAVGVEAEAVGPDGAALGPRLTVRARAVALAAGAIRTPALLMRSGAPDPSGQLGRRTFLHPVVGSVGIMRQKIEPYYGAPQTVYSDQFLWPDDSSRVGFKLETPPIQPLLAAAALDKSFGPEHAALMRRLPRFHGQIALMRDGFSGGAPGGAVTLQGSEGFALDYPVTPALADGFRRGLAAMMELQFAAGARAVLPWHLTARPLASLAAARAWLDAADLRPGRLMLGSAHVMGGCAMGGPAHAADSPLDEDGRLRALEGLWVVDGSAFPTSLGVNPQVTIFALARRAALTLAARLGAA